MPSTTTSPNWQGKFSVTLNRLKNNASTNYRIMLGIRGFDMTFGSNNAKLVNEHCWIAGTSATSFNISVLVDDVNYFRFLKVSYLAVKF